MNKRITVLALAVFAATSLPASAQLGGLLGAAKSAPAGDIDSNVKGFLEKSVRVESTINKAALAIVAAYASEEDRAQLQSRYDEIGKSTDPKEAGARFQATYESSSAAIKKLSAESDLAERTSKLSERKKQQLAAGVANFLLGAIQTKDLTPTGQNLLTSASTNPMNIAKIVPIKDALPRLANAASLAGSTIPQFAKVLQGANVTVAVVTSSSKEVMLDKLE